MTATRIIHS